MPSCSETTFFSERVYSLPVASRTPIKGGYNAVSRILWRGIVPCNESTYNTTRVKLKEDLSAWDDFN